MKKTKWQTLITFLALVLIAPTNSWADDVRVPVDQALELEKIKVNPIVADGAALFEIHCVACHQSRGSGLVGFAPSLQNPDFLALASDEYIARSIREGRPGTAMVGRPDLLDEQVDAILAFLRSFATKASVMVDEELRVTGDQEAGAGKFALYCAACHGPNGEGYSVGVPGTGIGLPGFLGVASDDYILKTLARGRLGTPMRPFLGAKGLANLSGQDAHDIVAHLRYLGESYPERLAATPVGPGNAQAGKAHFDVNCAACHQAGGIGKVGFAPAIRNVDFLTIASDDFIRQTIVSGRLGTGMLARPDLVPQTVNDIIAYLRSVSPDASETIELDESKILRGDAEQGEQTFSIYCASCHGSNGEGYAAGVPGPGIGLPGFLGSASDDYLFHTVKRGRRGTPMRGFLGSTGLANLAESDLFDIIAHLRVLEVSNATAPATSSGDDFE